MTNFGEKVLGGDADVLAPDGSEVRLLITATRASMAHFRVAPGGITKAVRHASVEEVWYCTGGRGRMWRGNETGESVVDLVPGTSIDIPVGTAFQFRADGDSPLEVVGVTVPPWPGMDEAIFVDGPWTATV